MPFLVVDRGVQSPLTFFRFNTVKSAIIRSNETSSVAYNCKLLLITISIKRCFSAGFPYTVSLRFIFFVSVFLLPPVNIFLFKVRAFIER